MNQQLDISHLEALAQSYFDCRLDRHEERDLAAVLATSPLSSPLIDEIESIMRQRDDDIRMSQIN